MNNIVHDFDECNDFSHRYSDAPWWNIVYQRAFSGFVSAVTIPQDGWAQRGGIDKVITLKSGRTVTVDEKVRKKAWPDFLLERWSDEERKKPGWVQKDLACDYIAYAFIPTEKCYLLPFLQLRAAWKSCGREWAIQFPTKRAQNPGYVTASVAVPIDVVLSAISEAMVIEWGKP